MINVINPQNQQPYKEFQKSGLRPITITHINYMESQLPKYRSNSQWYRYIKVTVFGMVKEMLKTPPLLQEAFWWEHCGGLFYSCDREELLPIKWNKWVIKTETGGWLCGRLRYAERDMNGIFKSPFGSAGESGNPVIENAGIRLWLFCRRGRR